MNYGSKYSYKKNELVYSITFTKANCRMDD